MAVSTLFSLATRTMAAQQAALQTTSHNIANANVVGYSRQQVELATSGGQYTGVGFFGKGVDVRTVSRSHDAFLTREATTTRSAAAMDQARLAQMQQLERIFPPGERGLGFATLEFLNAVSDLASRPGDTASRQVVLARAQELAGRFSSAQSQLDAMQRGVIEDLRITADSINTMSSGIAALNQQIAALNGLGQPSNDLLDDRDRLVGQLAEKIQVTTLMAEDGTMSVFAAGGQRLVLGVNAQQLTVLPDDRDPGRAALAVIDNGVPRRLPAELLGGGQVAGQLKFQNADLVDARNALGQMAAAIAGAVNAQQRLGMNLHEPAGSIAPRDLFSVGAARATPAAANAKDPSGAFIGRIDLTVTRPAELLATDYDLKSDPSLPPGTYVLTRLSDGLVRNVVSGDEVDGFRIDVGTPAPTITDRFLLQPVAQAGLMKTLLSDPRDLAAASPLTATAGGANTGTAAISAFRITDPSVNPQNTATITFTDDLGSYAWELRDRSSGALVTSGTGNWTPGQPIPGGTGPGINGFAIEIDGVPRTGDTMTVDKTLYPASNNGNALSLAALRDQRLVGLVRDGTGALGGGVTATDAYAGAMTQIGVRVQGAATLASISEGLAAQAETTRSSASGVNLDEEAARLIEFQQSYQAAAKILQIAQSIFDTLLQTAAR